MGQARFLPCVTLPLLLVGVSQQAWANQPTTLSSANQQLIDSAKLIADVPLYTTEQIESRLQEVFLENPLLLTPNDTPNLSVSLLDDNAAPIGLDVNAITKIPTPDTLRTLGINLEGEKQHGIDPTVYIPEYEFLDTDVATSQTVGSDELKQPNLAKRLYNRLFNDGVETVVRLQTEFYQQTNLTGDEPRKSVLKIDRNELKQEPFANIKAALEDVAAESIVDFQGALPRLRQTALAAARAVGFYDVDLQIVKAEADKINVIVHHVGEPVRIASQVVEVRGEGKQNSAYQKAILTNPLSENDIFHHGNYEATKTAIVDVSAEAGYFDGKWLNNSVDVILPDNMADVSLVYDSGEQYAFDEVVFFTLDKQTGQLTTDPEKLPVKPELLKKLVTFNMGDAYNRTAVRDLSNNLLATGYFNAVNTEAVLPEASVHGGDEVLFENQQKSADILPTDTQLVDLGDGMTAQVAPIEFTTSQVIQDKLALVRQKAERLYTLPDDRLLITDTRKQSRSILGRIADAVSNVAKVVLPDESGDELNVSDDVQIPVLEGRKTAQAVHADKKVPLYVFVATDKPRDAQIGLGWGSDSGVRLVTKFEHNLVNKNGYQAGADFRWSKDRQGVSLYATKPMSHPLNDKLRAYLSYDVENFGNGEGSFDLRTRTLQQGISRNIINHGGWNRSYSLRYRLDELETGLARAYWQDLPVQFAGGRPTQEALLAGYAMNKTQTDNPVNPMRGYRQNYSLEVGSRGLVTDTNMAIVRADIGGVYSFGDNAYGKRRAHQLVGGVNLGYLWADDFSAVPYKLRFFAGGDRSIRGYNHESLSPFSDKGYLLGGQVLAVASGEYNYEVLEGLRLAAFADVGSAYDKQFSNDTKVGAGLGLRWASPVGQVRVDVATGVGEADHPIKLHFFIGTPF